MPGKATVEEHNDVGAIVMPDVLTLASLGRAGADRAALMRYQRGGRQPLDLDSLGPPHQARVFERSCLGGSDSVSEDGRGDAVITGRHIRFEVSNETAHPIDMAPLISLLPPRLIAYTTE